MTSLDTDEVLVLDRRTPSRLVSFLNIDFAPMNSQTLFQRVVEASEREDGFRYLVTPNVDHVVRTYAQPHTRELNEDAWINVNDSRILETLANWSGFDLPACPGSDLTRQILTQAIVPSEPVVIIGCTQLVVDEVTRRYGLTDVRWYQPPMGLKSNPQAVADTAQFCIDNPSRFTFLCVGGPQQEMVAQAIKRSGFGRGVGLCVGASLEFVAGTRKRAPAWMQKARLEWLFRLSSEPKLLWKRYLIEGPKIFGIWWQWRAGNK
jgi:N-acetylglucosaminyldiphosphoundecaprenol N-acetyl-beta-D-mannosaminyltransferase